MRIRKRLVELAQPNTTPEWLAMQDVARIELTSEDHQYPIDSALIGNRGTGWRASGPGEQRIRLVFDNPQAIRLIHLVFEDAEQERLQEFTLRWSSDRGLSSSPSSPTVTANAAREPCSRGRRRRTAVRGMPPRAQRRRSGS